MELIISGFLKPQKSFSQFQILKISIDFLEEVIERVKHIVIREVKQTLLGDA